jgi:hypothetical protein
MSGFFKPAASKMSITLSDEMARETICRTASSSSSGDLPPLSLMLLEELGQNLRGEHFREKDIAIPHQTSQKSFWNRRTRSKWWRGNNWCGWHDLIRCFTPA